MNSEQASKTSTPPDTRTPVIVNAKTLELLIPTSSGFFEGFQASPEHRVIIINDPKFHWTRERIPFDLWVQVVSFMKWSQTANKSEAHCSLFYNTELNIWDAWAFPQLCVGMTVRLLEDDPDYAKDRARFGKGWIMAGSVHHHCESAAFQSSTDSADERDKDGVHITVGKVSEKQVDLHTRQVWNGNMAPCEITSWIALPHWTEAVPPGILTMELRRQILATVQTGAFPEEWKSRTRTTIRPERRERDLPQTGHSWFKGQIETFLNGLTGQFQTNLTQMNNLLGVSNTDAHALSKEDQELRGNLKMAIFKTRWPSLYCEAVLEQMIKTNGNHRDLGYEHILNQMD